MKIHASLLSLLLLIAFSLVNGEHLFFSSTQLASTSPILKCLLIPRGGATRPLKRALSLLDAFGLKSARQKLENFLSRFVNGLEETTKKKSDVKKKKKKNKETENQSKKKKECYDSSNSKLKSRVSSSVLRSPPSTSSSSRVLNELKSFLKKPPAGMKVTVGTNLNLWIIHLTLPDTTAYANETYKLRVKFPESYPSDPPSVYFLKPTPAHEHVYTNGDICLSLLGGDWRPTLTAEALALSIMSMLSSARKKSRPQDNSAHAGAKPGGRQDNWVYHDDSC